MKTELKYNQIYIYNTKKIEKGQQLYFDYLLYDTKKKEQNYDFDILI